MPPLVVAPPDPLLTPLGLGWRGVGVGQLPSEPSSVAVDKRMDLRGGGPPSPLVVASAAADETGVCSLSTKFYSVCSLTGGQSKNRDDIVLSSP